MIHFKAVQPAAVLAALLILAGCAPRSADKPQQTPPDTAAPPPLSAASSSAPKAGPAATGLALKTPGTATLYRFVAAGPDADDYVYTPLVLPALTRGEIASLRAGISYDELLEWTRVYETQAFGEHAAPRDRWDIAGDEERGRALDFIADVTNANIPAEPFDSVAEAPGRFLVRAAVLNTPSVNWGVYGGETYEGIPTYPSLEPLTGLIGDSTCFLQEHVEITAKRLFGDSVPLVHSGAGLSPWRYHEYAGVYTPPHMGTP